MSDFVKEQEQSQLYGEQGSSADGSVYRKKSARTAFVTESTGADQSLLLQGDDDDSLDDDYPIEDAQEHMSSKRTPAPWSSALGAPVEDDFIPEGYKAHGSQLTPDSQEDYEDTDEEFCERADDDCYCQDDADCDPDEVEDNVQGDDLDDADEGDDEVNSVDAEAEEQAEHAGMSTLLAAGDEEYDDDSDEDEFVQEEEDGETFEALGLSSELLRAIKDQGFEKPTPIQLRSIPVMMSGRDMIGQAQTGTGKTAAFALPVLSCMPKRQKNIFALILEPTRELALQVAESFTRFARHIDGFRVAPVYGGASYDSQIRCLRQGAQVVVATPGRLIDLIEKGRLDFSDVQYIVIDEADEMLRMGFIDDVDWILDQVNSDHQTALFSATMPPVIRRIARSHLTDPEEVHIESKTTTAATVRQRYWVVSGANKIDAMTRMLEVEPYEASLVFVRTKTDAEEVANQLTARGLQCAALHGDIPQRQREKIIERLKRGLLDIIIATDVAARGLDVDRITLVFNYDIPYDAESYVHRIGRTGRAGRNGEAILFVTPGERRALRRIERVTRQRIEPMAMPTIADVNRRRLENFRKQIVDTIDAGGLDDYLEFVNNLLEEGTMEPNMLCAALARMAQRDGRLLLEESGREPKMRSFDDRPERGEFSERGGRRHERRSGGPSAEAVPLHDFPDIAMVRYRLAVGRRDSVKPGQIVGAIANEANIESKYIGEISIYDSFCTVDLPEGMPAETREILARARVCGRSLDLRVYTAEPPAPRDRYRDRSDRFDRGDRRRSDRGDRGDRGFERSRRDEFDYMDEGEYRHEKGDINGNSINYRPGGSRRSAPRDRGFAPRPGFDFGSGRRDSRRSSGASRPRPRLGSSRRGY